MNKKLHIRNSSADFLIFSKAQGWDSIGIRFEEDTRCLNQQLIAGLFQTTVPDISMHIKGIYADGELIEMATFKNFLTVRQNGGYFFPCGIGAPQFNAFYSDIGRWFNCILPQQSIRR